MPTLPAASEFTASGTTEGTFKASLTTLLSYLSSLLGSAGTQPAALSALGAILNGTLGKTAAYTVVAADRGKLIDCSGTWTLAIDAVATLGAGFAFCVRNGGGGAITINPNLSEPIDGVASITLVPGESAVVAMNDTATGWITLARNGTGVQAATASVNGYMTAAYAAKLDGIAAGATVGVSKDVGAGGVGVMAYMLNGSGSPIAAGATVAGGNLLYENTVAYAASGTWRNVTDGTVASASSGTFQRIA